MFFSYGFCQRINKVFVHTSLFEYPIIMDFSFSYVIQLSYSPTEYITVLRFAGKGYSVINEKNYAFVYVFYVYIYI